MQYNKVDSDVEAEPKVWREDMPIYETVEMLRNDLGLSQGTSMVDALKEASMKLNIPTAGVSISDQAKHCGRQVYGSPVMTAPAVVTVPAVVVMQQPKAMQIGGHYFTFPTGGSPTKVVDRYEARQEGDQVTFYRNGRVGTTTHVNSATATPMESYRITGNTLHGSVTATIQPNGDIQYSHGYTSRREERFAEGDVHRKLPRGMISARELEGFWVGIAIGCPWFATTRALNEDEFVHDLQCCCPILPLCGRQYRRESGSNTFRWVEKGNEDYEHFNSNRCACMAPGTAPGGAACGVRIW